MEAKIDVVTANKHAWFILIFLISIVFVSFSSDLWKKWTESAHIYYEMETEAQKCFRFSSQ